MDLKNNDLYKRIIVFLLGFVGLQVFAVALQLLNFFHYIFLTFDLNLFVNRVNFSLNSNVILNYTMYIIVFSVMLIIIGDNNIQEIINKFKDNKNVKEGFIFGVLVLCSSMFYNIIIQNIIPNISENQNEDAVRSIITLNPFLSTIAVAIVGPIVEEFTYRYGLFGALKKKSKKLAYFVTIILFALIHFSFDNATAQEWVIELANLPSYMIAAAILCYAYDRNDSLATSLIAHIFNNAYSVLMTLLIYSR